MKSNTIFVVSGQVVNSNSKINWPDLNYPNGNQTILRTLHIVDHKNYRIQLDDADGPWFEKQQLPQGAGFYKQIG